MDMEDMVSLGKKLQACPYYGTRRMAKTGSADVVCMPYSLLFRSEARAALGIKLKGRVVIVDEAHNLHDAINGMHSLTLCAEQFETAIGQLQRYQSVRSPPEAREPAASKPDVAHTAGNGCAADTPKKPFGTDSGRINDDCRCERVPVFSRFGPRELLW